MSALNRLKQMVADRYDSLKAQVAHRLGSSSELAGDALHDAFLRLAHSKDLDSIQHPHTYLVAAALNGAIDRIRHEARLLSTEDIDALFELSDPAPGPEQVLEARQHMQALLQRLDRLPPRQCALFIASRVHGVSTAELAQEWGISAVMVRREIRHAHEFCLETFDDNTPSKAPET